jgi:hypothetical protein
MNSMAPTAKGGGPTITCFGDGLLTMLGDIRPINFQLRIFQQHMPHPATTSQRFRRG